MPRRLASPERRVCVPRQPCLSKQERHPCDSSDDATGVPGLERRSVGAPADGGRCTVHHLGTKQASARELVAVAATCCYTRIVLVASGNMLPRARPLLGVSLTIAA